MEFVQSVWPITARNSWWNPCHLMAFSDTRQSGRGRLRPDLAYVSGHSRSLLGIPSEKGFDFAPEFMQSLGGFHNDDKGVVPCHGTHHALEVALVKLEG